MTGVRALFAGPGAVRALAAGGTYGTSSRAATGAVEIVLPRAAYVRLEQDWLLLAEPAVPFGPLSLSIHGLTRLGLAPGWPARVAGGWLLVGDVAVSLERVRERRGARLSWLADGAATAAAAAAEAELPAAAPQLDSGIRALARGRLSAAVAQLAGRGPGLTPAGDDVLAGYAASRFVLDAPQAGQPRLSVCGAGRCSPLGLAYLQCAEHGELPDPAARLLGVIGSGSLQDVPIACAELSAWGASSGTALGWGIAAAFRRCPASQWAAEQVQVK